MLGKLFGLKMLRLRHQLLAVVAFFAFLLLLFRIVLFWLIWLINQLFVLAFFFNFLLLLFRIVLFWLIDQLLAFAVFFAFLLLLFRIALFWLIWLFEWLISCLFLLSFSIFFSSYSFIHLFRIGLFWMIKETASAPPETLFSFLLFFYLSSFGQICIDLIDSIWV